MKVNIPSNKSITLNKSSIYTKSYYWGNYKDHFYIKNIKLLFERDLYPAENNPV